MRPPGSSQAIVILLIVFAFLSGGAEQSAVPPVLNFERIVNNWPEIAISCTVACCCGYPVGT